MGGVNARHAAFVIALGAAAGLVWLARGAGLLSVPHQGSGAEGGDLEGDAPGIAQQLVNVGANAVSNPTSLSPQGLAQLQAAEGFSPTPYSDFKGKSIGFGHLIKSGEEWLLGAVISEAQAAELLAGDVAWAERAVSAAVSAPISQAQFDALVLICYNIGETAFKRSTLVKLLNAGDYDGAADQFLRWNRAGGEVNSGLVARRDDERRLFTEGTYA